MAREVIVKYEDGSSVTVALKPRNLIAAERMLGKPIDEHGIEATYMAAWNATKSEKKFDAWLDEVETLEQVPTEDTDADPTSAPSPAELPT